MGHAIRDLFSVLGLVDLAVNYVEPMLDFLGIGPGVLLTVVAGVLLILWVVYSQQPVGESSNDSSVYEDAKDTRDHAKRSENFEGFARRTSYLGIGALLLSYGQLRSGSLS